MTIAEQWREALADMVIRYPDPESKASISIRDDGMLTLALDRVRDTSDLSRVKSPFTISNVKLAYFPGTRLARQWMAAAWAGYLQHEALELVTINGRSPLDPHADPYTSNPCNRGLRDGLPVELTPETLVSALAVVMPRDAAEALVANG